MCEIYVRAREGQFIMNADGSEANAATLIDARIAELDDWRGALLAQIRAAIHAVVPDVVEEWKWRGTPVWSCAGILCTGESYRDKVKLTFMSGAAVPDPEGLFNAGLDGNARRAIDFGPGDTFDIEAFQRLMTSAVALNRSKSKRKR